MMDDDHYPILQFLKTSSRSPLRDPISRSASAHPARCWIAHGMEEKPRKYL